MIATASFLPAEKELWSRPSWNCYVNGFAAGDYALWDPLMRFNDLHSRSCLMEPSWSWENIDFKLIFFFSRTHLCVGVYIVTQDTRLSKKTEANTLRTYWGRGMVSPVELPLILSTIHSTTNMQPTRRRSSAVMDKVNWTVIYIWCLPQ